MIKALYRFFTPFRRSVIGIFSGQWWKDICCHFGIHQDVINEPSNKIPGGIDFFCPNPHCGAILWEDGSETAEEGPKKDKDYRWSMET